MSIKGCTLSPHSNIKPPEPEKPIKDENEDKNEVIEVRAPIRESLPRPPVETAMRTVEASVTPAHKELIDNMVTKSPTKEQSNGTG